VKNALFPAQCTGQGGAILYSEAAVLAKKAHMWAIDVFEPVQSLSHATKLYRTSAHLLKEFCIRGNVTDGKSVYEEALYKAFKAAYKLTNRKRRQFVLQMVLSEQAHILMHDGEENSTDGEEDPRTDTDLVYEDPEGGWNSRPQLRKRRQRRRRRTYSRSTRWLSWLWEAVLLVW